jgi:hypothetical protein
MALASVTTASCAMAQAAARHPCQGLIGTAPAKVAEARLLLRPYQSPTPEFLPSKHPDRIIAEIEDRLGRPEGHSSNLTCCRVDAGHATYSVTVQVPAGAGGQGWPSNNWRSAASAFVLAPSAAGFSVAFGPGPERLGVPDQLRAVVGSAVGGSTISGRLMRNFTPCCSGIASTVPSCMSAILRTIARPRPEPGSARAFADR